MQGIDFIQDLAVVMVVAGLVGWACQRLGLSSVVGFLLAGVLIGPHTFPFALVADVGQIETLAKIGLVFLMFSIGLKLSLRRIRGLGGGLLVATFTGAFFMYQIGRSTGVVLGWTHTKTVFLAAMFMVSSSSIIGKVLQDVDAMHEKFGQTAMGVSVLEDIVAIFMLVLLNSLTSLAGAQDTSMGQTLGLLGAFVVMAGVGGLLVVPWLLKKISVNADEELLAIVTAGLLFMLAVMAERAGFSLALGAFLLGAIVAETPHRIQADRAFEGMRDLFSAVFFVAIGMMIDLKLAVHLWWLVLLLGVVCLVGRTIAVTTGMLISGAVVREAVRVGMAVTTLGEFSFIIAQMGVAARVIGADLQAIAVIVSLLSTLAAPFMVRISPIAGECVEHWIPRWLANWLEQYRDWLERLFQRQQRSLLWRMSRKRMIQIAMEVLFVTGLLTFAEPLLQSSRQFFPHKLFPRAPELIFGSLLTVAMLIPLVAIWRNVGALALIYSELGSAGMTHATRIKPVIESGIKTVSVVLIFVWLSSLPPLGNCEPWIPLLFLVLVLAALLLMRRKLVYWHSVLEVELQQRLTQNEKELSATTAPWLAPHGEWQLGLTECVLRDLAMHSGQTLGELGLRAKFGCTVAGIERQGVMIATPSPDTALYPRDRVLLLGDTKQMNAGKAFLKQVSGEIPASNFDEVLMEKVWIPLGCKLSGCTLAELAPTRRCGVQLAGINRGGLRLLNPTGEERLIENDDVLVLGTPDQIKTFRTWMEA